MFLILDSTEFFDAPQADSNSFKVVQEFLHRTDSQLIVPEVVFRETINHAREQLANIRQALPNIIRDYERLQTIGIDALRVPMPDFDRTLRAYEATLRRTLQNSFRATFLPLPTVDHTEVLDRALQRKRPFLKNKDGYRDTLIWLSIVARVREHPGEYVFITNNTKDFSEHELLSELGDLPPGCSLQFMLNLNTFIDSYAKLHLERLDEVLRELREHLTYGDVDIKQELSDLSSGVLRDMGHKLRIRRSEYRDIEEPYYIEEYTAPRDIAIEDLYRAQEDLIVECTAVYDCTVNGYVFKADAYGLYEEHHIEVTDWDWNEHYVEVEFSAPIETRFLIRLAEEEDAGNDDISYSAVSIELVEATIDEVPM